MLLGIHFAQFPERWQIDKTGLVTKADSEPLIREGAYVRGMSGMTCVLPAWSIKQKAGGTSETAGAAASHSGAGRSTARITPCSEFEPSIMADNPSHKEDFSRLLDAVVKGRIGPQTSG